MEFDMQLDLEKVLESLLLFNDFKITTDMISKSDVSAKIENDGSHFSLFDLFCPFIFFMKDKQDESGDIYEKNNK